MTDLATRLEQAGPESQAELLEKAWRLIRGDEYVRTGVNHFYRFKTMLDCGAYLSAAEMLVDSERFTISLSMGRTNIAVITDVCGPPTDEPPEYEGTARTIGYALAAACLRAVIAGKES